MNQNIEKPSSAGRNDDGFVKIETLYFYCTCDEANVKLFTFRGINVLRYYAYTQSSEKAHPRIGKPVKGWALLRDFLVLL